MNENGKTRSFGSWRSSIWTHLSAHIGDFVKGSLGNRIRFFSSAIENGYDTLLCTAILVRDLVFSLFIQITEIVALVSELNLTKAQKKFASLKKLPTVISSEIRATFDDLKINLFRTVNSVIGIAVPVLAYWINRAIKEN